MSVYLEQFRVLELSLMVGMNVPYAAWWPRVLTGHLKCATAELNFYFINFSEFTFE